MQEEVPLPEKGRPLGRDSGLCPLSFPPTPEDYGMWDFPYVILVYVLSKQAQFFPRQILLAGPRVLLRCLCYP